MLRVAELAERALIYRFEDFELDEERFELRRRGSVVDVQPKALELLLRLVRNHGHAVSKPELMAALWPDSVVTEGSLARAVSLARAALGDRGAHPAVIATVPRRGYRFEAAVRALGGGAGAGDPLAPAPEDPASRYVGRVTLLARLEARLDAALAGAGCILLLAGEAGIGKTRTAELLARRARQAGACVAAAWGIDEGAAALSSWARVLRALVARAAPVAASLRPAQRAALARLAPELGAASDRGAEAPRGDDVERFALFDAVQTLLLGVAGSAPLALFLDDLHAADADSIVLLELLGQALAGERIAIVVTCRDEDAPRTPRQARAIERLLRLTSLERWPLTGLRADEVRELVRSRLGAEGDAALCEALERQTGGNPLLLGEALRSLEARGLLGEARDVRGWEALLPRGVRHLLLPKLRLLSAGTSEVLACAAAIGVEVEPSLLERCASDPERIGARLGELYDAGLLLPGTAAGRPTRFAHGLVRDALYEELLPEGEVRRAMHTRVWRALEQSELGPEGTLPERAHHALEAVPLAQALSAIELAQRAGERAAGSLDFERAAAWYGRALAKLSFLPAPAPELRAALLLGLGAAETHAHGLERARASYREAADHARALGRSDLLAAAALGFAHRPSSSGRGDAESIRLLEEARRGIPPTDEALRIRMLSRLAVELRYEDRARAQRLVQEAVVAARRLADPAALAQALDDSSFVRWSPDDTEAWIALNGEVVEVAQSCGELELAFAGQRGRTTGFLELGDRVGVEREARASARLADALRTPHARWYCAAHRALLALVDGDLAAAEEGVLEALALGDRIDSSEVALEAGGQLVYLRMEQGRGHEIESAVRTQLARFPAMAVWRAALARILAGEGRSAEARVELERLAQHRFVDVPRDRGYLPALAMVAEAARATGEVRVAASIEPLLAPYARLHAIAGTGLVYYGSVAHALGAIAATRSRWDEAIGHFEAALRAEEAAGARLWAARSRIESARALLARDAPADRARAATLAGAALAQARLAGWVDVANAGRDVEAALWASRGRHRRAAPTLRPQRSER